MRGPSLKTLLLLFALLLTSAWFFTRPARRDSNRTRALLALVPGLSREVAHPLATGDSATWAEFVRNNGPRPVMDAHGALHLALNEMEPSRFRQNRDLLESYGLRLAEALESQFDFGAPAADARLLRSFPTDRALEFHRARLAYTKVWGDSIMRPTEKLARLEELRLAAIARGDPFLALSALHSIAVLDPSPHRPARQLQLLTDAAADARRLEDRFLECQILGELAVVHARANNGAQLDSCLEAGVRLARRHRFPDQASRLLFWLARRALFGGRPSLAAHRLGEAISACEGFGGGSARLRATVEYAQFLASLGCWDLVDDVLRRLPALFRESPDRAAKEVTGRTADFVRARAALARGDTATGQRLFRSVESRVLAKDARGEFAALFRVWSAGLQANQRYAEALVVTQRGLALSDSHAIVVGTRVLALRRARLLEHLGRYAEAADALQDVKRRISASGGDADEVEEALMVMEGRLMLRAGHRENGLAMLRKALSAQMDAPMPENPTPTDEALGLSVRDAVHELAGLTPKAGYGFEMTWRSRARKRPGRSGGMIESGDPLAPVRSSAEDHLVFAFSGQRLLRWHARPTGVVLDTLDYTPSSCLADVREAVRLMRTEPPAPSSHWGDRTHRALRQISQKILPAALPGTPEHPAPLAISPDGPLMALPFEALPLTTAPDTPLALIAVIRQSRGWQIAPRAQRPGPALVVSNPTPVPELRRRYGWPDSLRSADADTAAARWPGSRVLRGEAATKAAFLRAAEGAARIYLAGHHVRNPAAPFLGFIPMAASQEAPPDSAMLQAADVRGLDLSTCQLVVLATCASGAPYRSAVQPGPSIGDAFLDAGARAVVTSYWDINDDETAWFMQRLLSNLNRYPDPAEAVARARRECLSLRGGCPPRLWAAWSVSVAEPAPEK